MEEINYEQFQKLDIRIGTIKSAEVPEWSHWVMKLTVDFGPAFAEATDGQARYATIFSGIMKYYKPEDMIGKQFPFVVNLKPKRIGPANEDGEYEYSNGMMLAVSIPSETEDPEEEKPILLNPQQEVPAGTKIR
jgi:methionine--tRNA ligase beta chain